MSKKQRYRMFAQDAKKWAAKKVNGAERRY
jgi:hypothetical protein